MFINYYFTYCPQYFYYFIKFVIKKQINFLNLGLNYLKYFLINYFKKYLQNYCLFDFSFKINFNFIQFNLNY